MCCLDALFMPTTAMPGHSPYTTQSACERMTRLFFATISGSCAVLSAIGFLLSGNPVPLVSSFVFGIVTISVLCPGPSWSFTRHSFPRPSGFGFGFGPSRRHGPTPFGPTPFGPAPRPTSNGFFLGTHQGSSTPGQPTASPLGPPPIITSPPLSDSRVNPDTGRAYVGRAGSMTQTSTQTSTGFPPTHDSRVTSSGRAAIGRQSVSTSAPSSFGGGFASGFGSAPAARPSMPSTQGDSRITDSGRARIGRK